MIEKAEWEEIVSVGSLLRTPEPGTRRPGGPRWDGRERCPSLHAFSGLVCSLAERSTAELLSSSLHCVPPDEDVLVKGKQSIKSQALGNQNSESEVLLEGDDDTLSSIEEKELENLTGPVSLSTSAQLVAPCVALKGTLSITSSELYFEVDEEDPGFKKIDSKFAHI
uniref:Uncharacterized protein n=1 Tax=Sphaerodactylus townsendi TaxID=933632 RepID=A0ACB8E7N8_9SAUR